VRDDWENYTPGDPTTTVQETCNVTIPGTADLSLKAPEIELVSFKRDKSDPKRYIPAPFKPANLNQIPDSYPISSLPKAKRHKRR